MLDRRNVPYHTIVTRASYGHNTTVTLQTSVRSIEPFQAKTHRNQAVALHARVVCAGQLGALQNGFQSVMSIKMRRTRYRELAHGIAALKLQFAASVAPICATPEPHDELVMFVSGI